MGKKARQEKKVRERKKTAQQRVVARRKKVLAEEKKMLAEQRIEENLRGKLRPIRNSKITLPDEPVGSVSGYEPSPQEIKDKLIIERLKHNQEILRAIEAEFQAEKDGRDKSKQNIKETTDKTTIKTQDG